LRTFAVYDERGTIVGVSTIARDMRRQRLAENRFRTTLEACPSGIVSVDEAGIVRLVNVETERMFGYAREELVGHSVETLVPGQFRADHAAHRDRYRSAPERRAMGVGRELFARRKDGTEFPVEIALSPYPAENGGTNVLAVVVDITERKAAEHGLAQYAERLKASNDELQQFAYVVSHDLKAPLRGIAAVAEWLAEDFRDVMSEDTKDNIGLMLERTSRMNRLIEGILEYSRVGSEEVVHDALDTAALIEDVIASVVTPDGVSIRVAGTLPNVVYGETQLRQVLQNLIQNALQHIERSDGTIVISCDDEGAFWRFHVRDDGVGIPERHMERIFGLFQTLKSKDEVHSTGVGLSIVKRIVERNGGRVTVASPPTGGADFSFTVPTKDSTPSQVHEAEVAS
jgi:PAS domain S-box-containing protein